MTILSYPIPNLINGVSQQAPQQRRDTQAEAQTNCVNSPVDGCVARPGSKHLATFPGENFANAFIQDVSRSDSEKYRIVISNGVVRVFDLLTGVEGVVTETTVDAGDYLDTTGAPRDVFRALTIEDTTYIANREIVPAMLPYTPPALSSQIFEAFIFFRAGDYRATYAFYLRYGVNNYLYFIQTPNGVLTDSNSNPTGVEAQIRTTYLADQLRDVLVAGQGGNPALGTLGFTVDLMGPLIRIRRLGSAGGDFTVDGYDDAAGEKMIVIKDGVKRFGQLPDTMWDGTVLKVAGTVDGKASDDYWVEWIGNDGTQGAWSECASPYAATTINEETMPHTLFSLGGNQYTFGPETWSTRVAGDGVETSQDPSFIGRRIQDLTFTRDRFGIMTEASISLSKTSQYLTHFPDTVQTQLDNAPIDVRLASTRIAILQDAVAHGQNLFFWADGIQFVLAAGDTLTQKTVEIVPVTDFDYSAKLRPVGIGDNLVFTNESGPFSQVYEQFAAEQGVNKEASDITAHVPKYIPSNLRWLSGSTTLKAYALNSSTKPSSLFVYGYFTIGDQKQQSAWNEWPFPASHNILYGAFDSNILRLCIQRPDGVVFETVNVSPDQVDEGGTYLTRLDRQVTENGCAWLYDEESDTTTVTLPYSVMADERSAFRIVTRAGGPAVPGRVFEAESWLGMTVTVPGNLPFNAKFFAGFIPSAEYEFSPFFPKDDQGAIIYERTQVRHVNVPYAGTGWTRALVERENGRDSNNIFAGRTLGSPENTIGGIAIEDGTLRIPVKSAHDRYSLKLINDSPFPSAWQSATVEYSPTVRARRA